MPVSTERVRIRMPVATLRPDEPAPAYLLHGSIVDRNIGLRHEGSWRSWMLIVSEWETFLQRDGAKPFVLETGERVGEQGAGTRDRVKDWTEQVDAGISGLGTCGSCTSWTVHDAISLEQQGKPAIAAVTEEFAQHGRNMAAHLGHGNLKFLVLPYPLEARPTDELRQIAVEYYPAFVRLLGAERDG